MLADGSLFDWTRQVEETADRLARDAVQQLQSSNQSQPTQHPARSSLPAGLFDPALPNHPLPSQPPVRAREVAKLAAVIASSPPPPTPVAVQRESASLLSTVDAILAEAEAVLRREQYADESEQKEGRQAERRQQLMERKAAAAQALDTKRRQRQQSTPHITPSIPSTSHTTRPHSSSHTQLPPPMTLRPQSTQSAELVRMKKAIEVRTEQRRRERDEAVKADMLDRQRRDIIARYEEAEGKRRAEERKEQEDELLRTQRERQAVVQQEQKSREDDSKRQQLRTELEDKKRQAADSIRQQRLLDKQQQQQRQLTHYTHTVQRRTDRQLLQRVWLQWMAAVVEVRRVKHLKAVSVWRYNCTVRWFGLWKSVARRVKEERRRVEEESMRRRKEDRRVQAAAHWQLRNTQRSATLLTRSTACSLPRAMHPFSHYSHLRCCCVHQTIRCMALVFASAESVDDTSTAMCARCVVNQC